MAILGIHHSTIIVPDLDRAVAFYARVLGFAVAQEITIASTAATRQLTGLEQPAA